jgi:cell division protein FtsW
MTATNGSVFWSPRRAEQARNWLLVYVIVLLAFGLLMVFSVGYVQGLSQGGGARFSLAFSQLCYMLLGGLVLGVVNVFPQSALRRMSLPLLVISLGLLFLVWMPGLGKEVRGGTRWIALGPLNLQPSEIAKISLILWLSNVFSRRTSRPTGKIRFRVPFVVTCVFCFLVLIEPHIGNACLMGVSAMLVMCFAGVKWQKLLAGTAIAITMGTLAIGASWIARPDSWGKKWEDKFKRIDKFYGNGGVEANRYEDGYQSFQALLAVSSGGLTGKGIGASRAKFNYLPDGHTDFIYAILGEELGFFISLLVLLCFLGLMAKGFSLGLQSKDQFGGLLLCGLSTLLGIQALINIGMATAWMPPIGVPLPFVSYGGSSLIASMWAIGLMLRASRFELESSTNGGRV